MPKYIHPLIFSEVNKLGALESKIVEKAVHWRRGGKGTSDLREIQDLCSQLSCMVNDGTIELETKEGLTYDKDFIILEPEQAPSTLNNVKEPLEEDEGSEIITPMDSNEEDLAVVNPTKSEEIKSEGLDDLS